MALDNLVSEWIELAQKLQNDKEKALEEMKNEERFWLMNAILEKFPVHYQTQILDTNNKLLLQYNLFSIWEVISRLSLFTNKKSCWFEHDRVFHAMLYPDWLSEQDLLDSLSSQIDKRQDTRIIQILDYNNNYGFNSNSCKHKINNTNCGHPELTGLLQLVVVSIGWIMASWIDFDIQKTLIIFNKITDFDSHYWANFRWMELNTIKQEQSDVWELILSIIEKILFSLKNIKLDK
jgi:hypothetical protein